MLQVSGYIARLTPQAQGLVRRAVITVRVLATGGHTDGQRVGESVTNILSLERPALSFQGSCLVHLTGGPGSYTIVAEVELEGALGERWGAGGDRAKLLLRVAPRN